MKKGNVELEKNTANPTLDLFNVVYHGVGKFVMTREDLKDLRSLIDTVLGEESNASKNFEMFKRLLIGKLNEYWFSSGCEQCTDNQKRVLQMKQYLGEEQNEKIKDWIKGGQPLTEGDCDFQEPSKKPSMTIGCMECGNNIKI